MSQPGFGPAGDCPASGTPVTAPGVMHQWSACSNFFGSLDNLVGWQRV
jgi:hypothetical protein